LHQPNNDTLNPTVVNGWYAHYLEQTSNSASLPWRTSQAGSIISGSLASVRGMWMYRPGLRRTAWAPWEDYDNFSDWHSLTLVECHPLRNQFLLASVRDHQRPSCTLFQNTAAPNKSKNKFWDLFAQHPCTIPWQGKVCIFPEQTRVKWVTFNTIRIRRVIPIDR